VGGAVGPQLKFAGWDNLVIKGKAAEPTYLYIEDDKIEFRSAKDLWGKGIDECMHTLHTRHLGSEVLLIGPAGENLVRFAMLQPIVPAVWDEQVGCGDGIQEPQGDRD
jgi:aldehyde:ferredoxin oxidoreductase